MRVGLISQEYPPETAKGGIATQTYLKAHGLTAIGHEVSVISRSVGKEKIEIDDAGVRVVRVPSTAMPVYTEVADWLSYSQRVAEEISLQHEKKTFDILDFAEWGCEGYFHLVNQTEWNHIPSVIQLHGPLVMLASTLGWPDPDSEFFHVGTEMERTCLRLADAVYSSSECSAGWCSREYGLDQAQIPILHSGVDSRLFSPRAVAKSSAPTIVFVGKMVPNKGADVLVDAACQIANEFPSLQLRMLGGGDDSLVASLHKKMAARGLKRVLDIRGHVERQDLPALLSEAHVFAAPSEYEGGPGFVYLEAMACGLPVIGCRGSGAAEVISDTENGFLIPPKDPSALADALRTLLVDADKREAMGNRARNYVLASADSRHCVSRISDFYEAVVDASNS